MGELGPFQCQQQEISLNVDLNHAAPQRGFKSCSASPSRQQDGSGLRLKRAKQGARVWRLVLDESRPKLVGPAWAARTSAGACVWWPLSPVLRAPRWRSLHGLALRDSLPPRDDGTMRAEPGLRRARLRRAGIHDDKKRFQENAKCDR